MVVRGSGFAAGEQIFLAWGEVDYFAEAHFAEIGAAQTDAVGEFEASIDVTRRCNQDGAWGIYALVRSERGQPERDGSWVEAILQVLGPAPDAAAMGSTTPVASIGTGAMGAPTKVATDETAIGSASATSAVLCRNRDHSAGCAGAATAKAVVLGVRGAFAEESDGSADEEENDQDGAGSDDEAGGAAGFV